jgi:hypothetical protein
MHHPILERLFESRHLMPQQHLLRAPLSGREKVRLTQG